MASRSPPDCAVWLPVLAAACLATTAEGVLALDQDKVLLNVNVGVTYDSNIFLISDQFTPAQVNALTGGRAKSDLIWGVGGGLKLDLPVSRQRFIFDASATQYYYGSYDELDYLGYRVRGSWDWRAGNDWYGQVSAGARQTREALLSAIGVAIPRLQKLYDGLVDARYTLTPRWELQAAVATLQTNYEAPASQFVAQAFQLDNFDYASASLGAMYRSPSDNSTGVRLRYEQGKWPNRPPSPPAAFDNQYTQYTLSALLDWHLTGRSRLYGDVGYTGRNRASASGDDFAGPSGRLTYEYLLTGKSTASASIYEIRGPVEDNTATYIKTTGIDLSYSYQFTSKIGLRADASRFQQDYLGTSLVPVNEHRVDKFTVFNLGVTWQAIRVLSFSVGAQYNHRTSNVPFGDYNDYRISLTGTMQF